MTAPQSANFHTTSRSRRARRKDSVTSGAPALEIPRGVDSAELILDGQPVRLTNLSKLFLPELNLTKRDLLQYYADVAPVLLPHLKHRAMVMKRYPNGAGGDFFFMKRAPSPRPAAIQICSIAHGSGNVIGFPVIEIWRRFCGW